MRIVKKINNFLIKLFSFIRLKKYLFFFIFLTVFFQFITLSYNLAQEPEKENSKQSKLEETLKVKKLKKKKKTNWVGVSIAFGGPIFIIGVGTVNWWLNHKPIFASDNFKFWDRGWFGPDTYTGGHDKIGHFYTSYNSQYIFSGMFEHWASYNRKTAIWMGALVTFIGFNLIEFFDAFTDYGWEYGDSIMNISGQALAILSQLYGWDKYLQMRFTWVPSPSYIRKENIKYYHFLEDYNGQRYFLLLNSAGISDRLKADFKIFRYVMPGAYYDTRGYRPELPEDEYHLRERNLGGALALDFSAIFQDWLPLSGFARGLATFFAFYQPSVIVGYGYDFNHKRWHSPDLSIVMTGPF